MISADATMCYACGTDLGGGGEEEASEEGGEEDEMACPSCGTIISSDATMCYACGAEIGAKKGAKSVAKVKKVVKKKKVL